jgi:16S rRNA (cytosine1402-N4)-methyltransferase
MDLGVSSPQLDDAARGFSFMHNGPLDMRMDQSQTLDAKEIVNKYDESDLIKIFRNYGEEKFARRIASSICKIRDEKNITSTLELADIVKKSVPYNNSRKHPATKVFQALRIEVNQELNELSDALPFLFDALKPQGRLLALTFHSLEDRIVKNFFKEITKLPPDTIPKFIPIRNKDHHDETKANVICNFVASPKEIEVNPRSRSARLRGVEKK